MRDYGRITPAFWIGTTGRSFRGDATAQLVALYLLTAPGSNMIGFFYCPVATIANDTGLPVEGAWKGLRRAIEAQFCSYDDGSEWVWVHEMARFQIEESLSPRDKRVVGIAREFRSLPETPMKQGFHARYKVAFHLPLSPFDAPSSARSFEGASEPHRSQEQEQEQEHKRLSQGQDLSGGGARGDRAVGTKAGLRVVNGPDADRRGGAR